MVKSELLISSFFSYQICLSAEHSIISVNGTVIYLVIQAKSRKSFFILLFPFPTPVYHWALPGICHTIHHCLLTATSWGLHRDLSSTSTVPVTCRLASSYLLHGQQSEWSAWSKIRTLYPSKDSIAFPLSFRITPNVFPETHKVLCGLVPYLHFNCVSSFLSLLVMRL